MYACVQTKMSREPSERDKPRYLVARTTGELLDRVHAAARRLGKSLEKIVNEEMEQWATRQEKKRRDRSGKSE